MSQVEEEKNDSLIVQLNKNCITYVSLDFHLCKGGKKLLSIISDA